MQTESIADIIRGHASTAPSRRAFIEPDREWTFAELDDATSRIADGLVAAGVAPGDTVACLTRSLGAALLLAVGAAKCGAVSVPLNWRLKPGEIDYAIGVVEPKVLVADGSVAAGLAELALPSRLKLLLVEGDDPAAEFGRWWPAQRAADPRVRVAPDSVAFRMFSSGTTGRPKGVLRPLPDNPPSEPLPLFHFLNKLWRYRADMIYLSPAPMYHSAPQAAVSLTIRNGGTVIVMEHFDPEQYLMLVEKHRVTHTQLVPTMFSRMLKLPEDVRRKYDLSSLEIAIHAAAPCPAQVKEQMIAWWGPIVHEYYGATEGLGFTACDTPEWLAHRGSVGKVMLGDLHILDEDMKPVPKGEPGEIWFKTASPFEYFNDPERTQQARSPDGTMSTVGDVGYVDDDGFLYLTDRSTFMIISGGVNIYPQECENLLITHPKVADAAVFGVPNEDLGEEVKAVIQTMPGVPHSPETAAELVAFCREHLASIKCPRSIDFIDAMPRLPTGKLYKKPLREKYWAGHRSRIV